MRKRNLPIATLLTPEALIGVADELNLANAEAVFVAIGEGQNFHAECHLASGP